MNSYILYVNDRLVDLYPGQVIATTIQRVDFGQLGTRKVNRTNQVKLPKSENNDITFGLGSSEKSTSIIPYSILPCKLIVNGYEVFKDGVCYVLDYEDDYSVELLENVFDFFANLKGKYISAINPITESAWTDSARDTARINTSGIIAAAVDWGRGVYDADFFLPCFFYHTVITEILESSGLTVSGDILADADFTDLAIPFAGDKYEYNPALVDDMVTQVEDPNGQILVNPATLDRIIFNRYTSIRNNVLWDFTEGGKFVNSTPLTLPISLQVDVSVSGVVYDIPDPSVGFWVRIRKNSGGTLSTLGVSSTISYPTTTGTLTAVIGGAGNTVMIPGDFLYAEIEVFGPGGGMSQITTSYNYAITGFSKTPTTSIIWNLMWPEIKAEDILLDFTIRFGIVYKQVGGTIVLKTLEAICQDRANAIDWTLKRANKNRKKIAFRSPYAQENQFNHTDKIDNQQIGRGLINIDNPILDKVKSIFTSPAGNTLTETITGYPNIAYIPAYDADSLGITYIVSGAGFRVLTLRSRTTETAIDFNGTPRTDFKIGYFVNGYADKDTGFQYFVDKYYPALRTALQRNKVVTFDYNLTELDIANYDPHKMIYDDGSYYLVNRIINYIPGKVVRVELFKLL